MKFHFLAENTWRSKHSRKRANQTRGIEEKGGTRVDIFGLLACSHQQFLKPDASVRRLAVVEVVREVPVEIVKEVPVYVKVDPAEWDARHGLTVQNRSQFGGVGMLLGKFEGNHERAGYIYVLEIVPGTPAASCADIDLQDILTHVDGKVVTGMPLSTVHQMIRGPEGTPIALEFIRHHSGERINVTLYRMAAVSEGSAVYTGQVNSVKVTSAGFKPHDATRSSYTRSGAYDHEGDHDEERQRAYL